MKGGVNIGHITTNEQRKSTGIKHTASGICYAAANPQAPTASEGGLQSTHYLNLLERSVRTEEAIKHLRLDFQKNQAAMDKRFEQVDKRFEQVDKRLEQMLERSVRTEEAIKHLRLDFQTMQRNMNKHFRILEWVIGLLFLGLIGLTGVILSFGAALLS